MKATKEQIKDALGGLYLALNAHQSVDFAEVRVPDLRRVLTDYERLLSAEAGSGKPRLPQWQHRGGICYARRAPGDEWNAVEAIKGEWSVWIPEPDSVVGDYIEAVSGKAHDLLSAQAAADAAAAPYYQIDDPVTLPSGDAR